MALSYGSASVSAEERAPRLGSVVVSPAHGALSAKSILAQLSLNTSGVNAMPPDGNSKRSSWKSVPDGIRILTIIPMSRLAGKLKGRVKVCAERACSLVVRVAGLGGSHR